MTRRIGTAVRATTKPVVVVAGEDGNDRKALRVVLEAMCPLMDGRIVEIRDSVRLRQATGSNLKARTQILLRKARARAARENAELACLFVHEDMDEADGDRYLQTHRRVQDALRGCVERSHYVLPVWEIEAWLLLFPAAFEAIAASWSVPSRYRGRDTGIIADPKRVLRTECCTVSRRYQEADAPGVLEKAVALSLLQRPLGQNRSWTQLMDDIDECCKKHLLNRTSTADVKPVAGPASRLRR